MPDDQSPVMKTEIVGEDTQGEVSADNKAEIVSSLMNKTEVVAEEKESEPQVEKKSPWKTIILVVLATIAITGLIGVGILLYKKSLSKDSTSVEKQAEEISQTSTSVPTLTPLSVEEKAELKIQILNGTGISGEAGRAKAYLEGLDYKNIKTGNADAFDYDKTKISLKEDKKGASSLLIEELSQKYEVEETTEVLEDSSQFDIVIVLGGQPKAKQ